MLNLKKTALAVIALGSTAAFAGTMGPVCSAVNVTVPCENTAWDLGGRALYMQATGGFGGDTYYASGNVTATQALNSSFSTEANPNWGWGFQLEGSYHYSTGNDFNLNWYHYKSGGVTNTLTSGTPNYIGATDAYFAPGTSFSNTPSWDQVNMEFGQHVDFGENKFARLHAGMNYSRVAFTGNSVILYANANDYVVDNTNTYNYSAVFNGFGPRVGMDLNYEWGNGLGVYGTGAFSVLAGSSKHSRAWNSYDVDNSVLDNGYLVASSQHRVVGELDAKLGFMYTYAMAQGDLSLDVGWAFAQYIGALNTTSALVNLNDNDYRQVNSDRSSNFGIQGLYFGLKWIGNVA